MLQNTTAMILSIKIITEDRFRTNSMALHLSVPAIEDKPLIGAEKRPKVVQGMLASKQTSHPVTVAQAILEQLTLLNRQAANADTRLKLMEIYRPSILNVTGELATHYCNQSLPLSENALMAATTARNLLAELAYGYKVAILNYSNRVFALGSSKTIALLIQRTIHALDQLLQVSYYTYVSTPEAVWSEIHRLYLHAAQLGLHETEVEDTGEKSSINLTYKRVLLLALANPHHLISADVDRVRDYLARYAQLAQLHPLGTPDSPAGVFLVRLNSDQAPIPLNKHRGEADMRTDILLITVELARQISTDLKPLENENTAASLHLAGSANQYRDLLNYLIKSWALAPKRTFSRLNKNESTNLCAGLQAVHYFLNGETDFAAIRQQSEDAAVSLNFTESTIDSSASHLYSSARWLVVNESAGGLALSKFPGVPTELSIGELLGMRSDRSGQWSLGVVRWANNGESGDLEIGAQMLAPTAKAVAVRPENSENYAKALLLPELPPLQQPATLVTACGTYHPARMMEVMMEADSKPVRVLLTRLLERTGSFERFQFSQL
jgi:hypothetical protein